MSPSEYQALVEFLTGKFAQVDGRLTQIDDRLAQGDDRFARIDRRFDELALQIDRRFAGLERRFDEFQVEVAERFREVFGHFDQIYGRLERLEQEYYAISQQLRRIEAVLVDQSGKREILERDLTALKEHVGLLQARIAEIERRLGG